MPQPTEYPLPRFIMLEITALPNARNIEQIEIALIDKRHGCKLDCDTRAWEPSLYAYYLPGAIDLFGKFVSETIEQFKEDLRNHGVY